MWVQSATRCNRMPAAGLPGQLTMWATMMRPVTSSALLPPYILAMATAEQDMKLKIACISRDGGFTSLCSRQLHWHRMMHGAPACWPLPCQQDLKVRRH